MTQLDITIKPDGELRLSLFCSKVKSERNTANFRFHEFMKDEAKSFIEIMVAAIPDLKLYIFQEHASRKEINLDELRNL